MSEKIVLIFSDEEIIFHKGSSKKTYSFTEGIEQIGVELKKLFSLTPKVPFCVLIDRNHQDVREEQLPPLFLWDRMRLLSHKRENWKLQGKFFGYHYFKQDKKYFLQWVNISQTDSLIPWLTWIKSLANPLRGVFFLSLEAGKFLKKHGSPSQVYHMLIYKISSDKTRHVIFKDKRLLLFRPLSGDEDLRMSLHFLSRTYPDIHEKLQILSLNPPIPLKIPHVTTLSNPQEFIDFLALQKRALLSLNITSTSQNLWIKRGILLFFVVLFCLGNVLTYQALNYKKEVENLLPKIKELNIQINAHQNILKNKKVNFLRSGLDYYNYIKSQIKDPLKNFESLSSVLKKHHIRLQNLQWNAENGVSMEIDFIMQNQEGNDLSDKINALLSSLATVFPNSRVHMIEGPFKSSAHETYKYPSELPLPRVHLRIILP